jgi:hypothetical protein
MREGIGGWEDGRIEGMEGIEECFLSSYSIS